MLQTRPEASDTAQPSLEPCLLEVRDLQVHFGMRRGLLGRLPNGAMAAVKAVDGVSFSLRRGEVLGFVGESGSGKTTLGRAVVGLSPASAGSIRYRGQEIVGLPERRLRPLRRHLQMIFQDPHAALNPAMDIGTAVRHPLEVHDTPSTAEARNAHVRAVFERVGLSPADHYLAKFPSDLSGGQKQRAVIARAISVGPDLMVADEPISMLDMSVRAKILELLIELRHELDLAFIYITHDLASAQFLCDRVAIMYLGRIVEIGPTERIFNDPKHPYTRALLHAIPDPSKSAATARDLPRGEVPDAARPPAGCSFHPRCRHAVATCGWEPRDLRSLLEQRWLTIPPDRQAAEEAVLGSLDHLDRQAGADRFILRPARGHYTADVLDLLTRMRSDDPTEPFWSGVTETTPVDEGVSIQLADPEEPTLHPQVDHTQVACHLYDNDATEGLRQ